MSLCLHLDWTLAYFLHNTIRSWNLVSKTFPAMVCKVFPRSSCLNETWITRELFFFFPPLVFLLSRTKLWGDVSSCLWMYYYRLMLMWSYLLIFSTKYYNIIMIYVLACYCFIIVWFLIVLLGYVVLAYCVYCYIYLPEQYFLPHNKSILMFDKSLIRNKII